MTLSGFSGSETDNPEGTYIGPDSVFEFQTVSSHQNDRSLVPVRSTLVESIIPNEGFPLSKRMSDCVLGRNTRMLACHSRDRTQAGFHLDKDLKSTMAVYYRALLKDICSKFYPTVLDRDGRDLRVGKIYSKIEKSNTPFIGIVCNIFKLMMT